MSVWRLLTDCSDMFYQVLGPDHIVFMCSETQSLRAAIERLSAHSTTRHHVKVWDIVSTCHYTVGEVILYWNQMADEIAGIYIDVSLLERLTICHPLWYMRRIECALPISNFEQRPKLAQASTILTGCIGIVRGNTVACDGPMPTRCQEISLLRVVVDWCKLYLRWVSLLV